jgi:hypothetical protein
MGWHRWQGNLDILAALNIFALYRIAGPEQCQAPALTQRMYMAFVTSVYQSYLLLIRIVSCPSPAFPDPLPISESRRNVFSVIPSYFEFEKMDWRYSRQFVQSIILLFG